MVPALLLALVALAEPPRQEVAAWRSLLDRLEQRRDEMVADLERAHGALLARARDEDPALERRLTPEPPRPRPSGYGILPEIRPDLPLQSAEPSEQRYSLAELQAWLKRDGRDAGVLAGRAAARPGGELEPMVSWYERSKKRLRKLEEHLSYHAWWQRALAERPAFFAERNRVMGWVLELRELQASGRDPQRRDELQALVRRRVAPFRRAEGLVLHEGEDGLRVLRVSLVTDIADEAFLQAFQDGVQEGFCRSPAALAARFVVELQLQAVRPAELYPVGAPEHGGALDLEDHLARFGKGARVLTTGADSTHAWQGRAILLGPAPVRPRTLAHEFGHLLGFADAYLRGYEGDPAGPQGAVLVEFKGLVDDLMGNPAAGRTSAAMIQELLHAYAPP